MFTRGAIPSGEAFVVDTWNVVFLANPVLSWWDWFTPPQMRHVIAYGYAARADAWVVVDPAKRATGLRIYSQADFAVLMRHVPDPTAQLAIPRGETGDNDPKITPTTCVTVIANTIGRPTRALRPAAFYRELASHAQVEVMIQWRSKRQKRTRVQRLSEKLRPRALVRIALTSFRRSWRSVRARAGAGLARRMTALRRRARRRVAL